MQEDRRRLIERAPAEVCSREQIARGADFNAYQQKKSLSTGLLNVALVAANANQLRYILDTDPTHPYYVPSIVMIFVCLVLQMTLVALLHFNSQYNINKGQESRHMANILNNCSIILIVFITLNCGLVFSLCIAKAKH